MREDVRHFKMDDKVKFTGRVPVEKVADYMRTMNVFVLPSRQEAFGCVIKEAQACGAMVVGSSNGGIPEVIGNGGIIVMEGDDFEKDLQAP